MKAILILLMGLTVGACTEKTVSAQYYKAHLAEAVAQNNTCSTDRDANATTCENALMAIQTENLRVQREKTYNNLSKKTQNVNDAFHK